MDIIFENENELTDEDLRKAYTNFIKKHYNNTNSITCHQIIKKMF